jgi:predicted AAA+ superfamily ATPase
VLDNLNTHGPASFYEALAPEEARRLAERFAFHDTPQHGSGLTLAEIEFRVLSRQCRNRRLGDAETLQNERRAWAQQRNTASRRVAGQFPTAQARIKLKRLYPVIQT